jgi:hypothetical protein
MLEEAVGGTGASASVPHPGSSPGWFTLSLLTAALLKAILEIVVAAKNRVKGRFRRAETVIGKVVAAVMLWVVLFGSKFLVLEAVGFVFGDRVSLGGFFSVTLLILALLLSRAAVRRLLAVGSRVRAVRSTAGR